MDVVIVKNISLSRLSKAYHLSYMQSVLAAVKQHEGLGVAQNLINQFENRLIDESGIVDRSLKNDNTLILRQHNATRDNYFRRLRAKLECVVRDSENEAVTEEMKNKIKNRFLDVYPVSITRSGDMEETAHLRSFYADLTSYIGAYLTTFGLTADMQVMKTANDNFEEAWLARIESNNAILLASSLRESTDAAYLQLIFSIAAIANCIATTDEEKQQRYECGAVIQTINTLIRDIKLRAYKDVASEDVNENENPEEPEE